MSLDRIFLAGQRPHARRLIVWLVLAALAICSTCAGLDAVLGPIHVHGPSGATKAAHGPLAEWRDIRRTHASAGQPAKRAQRHDTVARHRHDVGDGSVVALGNEHPEEGTGSSLSAQFLHALSSDRVTGTAPDAATAAAWRVSARERFASCDTRRLDRPPSA
jgi:hypothetical protein